MRRGTALLVCGLVLPLAARAQEVTFSGLLDTRLIAPSGERSNFDGGLGKFRWGDGRGSPVVPDLGGANLRAGAAITPEMRAVAEFRYDPRQKTAIDVIDAWVRWRPVSTSRWRWSLRAGAFFPPVSLENDGVGWTSEWTLTPSMINSWIGSELRVIGGETSMEWRGDVDRFGFVAAAFGLNEPAGMAIAAQGWTFNDRATGLFDHLRMPDFMTTPGARLYSYQFRQFDHAVGWYLGTSWERPDTGRIALLHYDNQGDPNAHDSSEFGWRTTFWSLGYSVELGPVTILAQAMTGATVIQPFGGFTIVTDYWAWYALAGLQRGDWRYAVRFDQFGTSQTRPGSGPRASEHGIAGTGAVTWTARKGLDITGEVITVDYDRPQRLVLYRQPARTEIQAQLAVRLSF